MKNSLLGYKQMRRHIGIFLILLAISLPAIADVKLPAIIGDNMVLQSDMETPIWGMADPGEKITVTMGDQRVATTANGEGKWKVILTQWKSGGPFEITISGKNEIKLQNVLVGASTSSVSSWT